MKIRFLCVKVNSGSTTMVTIVNSDGKATDILDKYGIEQAIMVNNKEKYHQSLHTTFFQLPSRALKEPHQQLNECFMDAMNLTIH